MLDMTRDEIDRFLDDQRIGRLCMAGTDGRPYSLPFPFCWIDGSLYIRVGMSGRKGDILQANDRVCFEVDSITDTLDDYVSVLIEGRLVPVEDLAEKARVKQANDEKYNRLRRGHRPGHGRSTPLAQLPLRKIIVEQLAGKCKEPAVAEATS
ncbi:MAG TPA: pyridoxamine 5'-phosphate oxidase family protein [Tepidisphaeraceae bacterium]|jgi:nitroimidazol reductase NimA-like FMN-containing flavoprotein (pyridoxamine 5'-phosphate oxidase superfamily)|nr:pyridoxamine 5'-phosphate oxidase family protein [Tepidisphaeraceae bacterium]